MMKMMKSDFLCVDMEIVVTTSYTGSEAFGIILISAMLIYVPFFLVVYKMRMWCFSNKVPRDLTQELREYLHTVDRNNLLPSCCKAERVNRRTNVLMLRMTRKRGAKGRRQRGKGSPSPQSTPRTASA